MSGGASCLFCRIIKGEIPCVKIAETAKSLAFMDIAPLSRGHCLVIPKQHVQRYHELAADSVADCALLLHSVAKAVGCENYNILQNNGAPAHQAVLHVHFHIIPKTRVTDGLCPKWHPLQEGASKEEIAAVGEEIRRRIAAVPGIASQ